ncbi:hypothetical protein AXF42_Ash017420 [Apostasia shenzhenica]|uniref:Uncharacterized protein n=1 Tax=Apostasia shenzhenica TaxID=1088818 RepID=A0A2H9ZYZ4_9ASPA|nr:hypothetical protein AXF42_Ash017420 [Apostasia shenzhenica]
MKVWNARRKVIKVIFDDWEESHKILYRYYECLTVIMPRTIYDIQKSQINRSEYLF